MTAPRTLLLPRRNPVAGAAVGLATLAILAVSVALVVDPSLDLSSRIGVVAVGAALATAGAASARALLRRRGGLLVDDGRAALGVVLTGPEDVWWLPLDRLAGVGVARSVSGGDDVAWTVLVVFDRAPSIVVVELAEKGAADAVAEALVAALQRPLLGDLPEAPLACAGDAAVNVRRRVALHGTLALLGLGAMSMGAVLLSQVAKEPVFAILFAPPILLLGLVLCGVVLVKRFSSEGLSHKGGLWTHVFSACGRTWTTRTVSAPRPRWQLRVKPAAGVSLELCGDDGVLVLGSGATTRSRESVEDLARLPEAFGSAAASPLG